MRDVELKIFPQSVAWLAGGGLALQDGAVRFKGQLLSAPLTLSDLEDAFR